MYTWLCKIESGSSAWWICPFVSIETVAGLLLFKSGFKVENYSTLILQKVKNISDFLFCLVFKMGVYSMSI